MSLSSDCRDAKHQSSPTPQQHIEEYLEVLAISEELGKKIAHISWIAERMDLARPSVVEMLKKLAGLGYVTYTARKGVSLTAKGRYVGLRVIRNHRMMETYVKNTVGVYMDEKVGCAIEHTMDENFTDAICTWLNHPRRCPHGYPIPRGKCCS